MTEMGSQIELFLQPGEYSVANADYRIRTLLGSCVSITLWHPALRIGAMSHYLLSTRGASSRQALDARYGEDSLLLMLNELKQAGVRPTECEAKIFGGGNMFPKHVHLNVTNIGQKNGEAAKHLLLRHNIPVIAECLFGIGHRQVVFDIETGDVWSRQIQPVDDNASYTRKTA